MVRPSWWWWTTRNWSALLLVTAGTALIVVGLVVEHDSLGRVGLGAGLLLLGVFADRLRRAKLGPTGAEIELDQRAAESTTGLSASTTPVHSPAFPDSDQVVDVHRAVLGYDVITSLARPREGPLVGCSFQLYLFDADQHMLLPVLEPSHALPSPGFRVGEGVAGTAWARGEFTIAEGSQVSDETFELSADKQARYTDLAVVAAMPVINAGGRVIAVLSASATDPGSGLGTDEAFEDLVALADAIARVLVDLLKWFSDDYDDG